MRAKYVYESISFNRGMDPKNALGIGKFGNLIGDMTELYSDILPSYRIKIINIPSPDLDKDPHKLVLRIEPVRKDGKSLTGKDLSAIKEMVDTFKQSYVDRMVSNGFYPVSEKYRKEFVSPFVRVPVFTISYDEMENQFSKIDR